MLVLDSSLLSILMYVFITLYILVDVGQFIDFILICLSLVINDLKKKLQKYISRKTDQLILNVLWNTKNLKHMEYFGERGRFYYLILEIITRLE